MLLLLVCIVAYGVVLAVRSGGKSRSIGQDEIRRIRHFADRMHREQALPYD